MQQGVNRETAKILELSSDQQYYLVMGHVMGMSHMAGVRSPERGACILDWYLENPAGKASLIVGSLQQYPHETPGVIIMSYINRACDVFDQ